MTDYYAKLLEARIETPDRNLNEAFRAAIYNLEYNWLAPYGWNECLHHWLAMWHMQHTAGAEWIGQADRSRLCTVTAAENLLPDGRRPAVHAQRRQRTAISAAPTSSGPGRSATTSSSPATCDFARKIAPVLDKVIDQTFGEHDPDGDLLLAWGLQIGNQEDYIATPHDGTTPTIEGINMMRTRDGAGPRPGR